MGIFDFFKKKKEDDLGDLGADFGPEPAFPGAGAQGMQGVPGGMGGMPNMPGAQSFGGGAPQLFGEQTPPPPQMMAPSQMSIPMSQPGAGYPQQGYGQQGGYGQQSGDVLSSRVEVLSSKLDALRTSIDRINEKLDYIERLLVGGRRYG